MCIYDVYGPCSCPHGRCFTVLAQCFTISSWVCSVTALTSCMYMYVRPIPEEGEAEKPREGFGYISRQAMVQEPPNYRGCVFWDKEEKQEYFDSMWRAGKAMSLLACGVGFVVMAIVMCTCCVAYQNQTFDGLFWTCIFCFVTQALTFLAWGSDLCEDHECTWSSGTGMNITAAMLWVWAANMIKSFPEALPPRGRGKRKPLYEDNGDDPHTPGAWDDEYDYDERDEVDDGEYYDDYDEEDEFDDDDEQDEYDEEDEYGEEQEYDDQEQEYYDDQQAPDGYVEDNTYVDQSHDTEYQQDPNATRSDQRPKDDVKFLGATDKDTSFQDID